MNRTLWPTELCRHFLAFFDAIKYYQQNGLVSSIFLVSGTPFCSFFQNTFEAECRIGSNAKSKPPPTIKISGGF